MANVTVSILAPNAFKIEADRWQDDGLDIEYLEIEKSLISEIAFKNFDVDSLLQTFIDGSENGYYRLIVKNAEKYVLAKGETNKLSKH